MKNRLGMKIFLGYLLIALFTIVVYYLFDFLRANETLSYPVSVLLTVSLILGGTALVGYFYSVTISRDLRKVIESARRIGGGDLTEEVKLRKSKRYPDEIDDLIDSINMMLENLRELSAQTQSTAIQMSQNAQNLSATAQEINASSEEVATTIEEISKGVELQASLVENTSKTVREMAGSIELTSSNAMVTATSVSEASGKAQQSGELANLAMEKMKQVFERMANSQEMVFKFGEKTKQIGKIVEMITNIARQTNLLALNATIEAARAGDYGKGFAVVADEVRKLAESTSTAAEQITDLVSEIEHESERVVSSMKETAQNIAEGREDLGTISLSLEEIVQMVTTAADKVRNISDLAQIQAEGAKELVRSIDEIAKVAHENATSIEQVSTVTQEQTAAMEDMSRATQELSQTADRLKGQVSRFRLDTERLVAPGPEPLPGPELELVKPEPARQETGNGKKRSRAKSAAKDDIDYTFE
jgi:methyl-accepting chemotaxis protein